MTYLEIQTPCVRAINAVAQRTYTHDAAGRLVKAQVAGETYQTATMARADGSSATLPAPTARP